ncbi:hypothetical protein [Nisaea sp.]|uniref:hypothetical protein n=1 Tax=Nisaea sp. TaxID=2024842 RepID=UPI002B27AA38|nr:hypothetical protein [Nisaea sp.]
MSVRTIRLELARNPDFPEGSSNHGYEFKAPLTGDGSLDLDAWQKVKPDCTVHRFWQGEPDEEGHLLHTRGRRWLFSYAEGEEDDEPIFKFDRHHFVEGEYVSITEHDGVQRTFRIVSVK